MNPSQVASFRVKKPPPSFMVPYYAWDKEFGLPHYLHRSKGDKANKTSFIYRRIKDYLDNTSLHGLKYITRDGNHCAERFLWIFCCLAALGGTVYFLLPVFQRYINSPIITTVESTSVPIWKVPFPAVTICNVNKGVASLINKVATESQEWREFKNKTIVDLAKLLAKPELSMELNEYSATTRRLKSLMNKKQKQLDSLMKNVMQPIERMALKCWWMGSVQNCSTLFDLRRTENGFCWSFNSKGMRDLIQETSLTSSHSLETYEYEESYETTPKESVTTTIPPSYSEAPHYHDNDYTNVTDPKPNGTPHKGTVEHRRVNGSGANMGLMVLLNPDLHEYCAVSEDFFGFQVRVHHPEDFPYVNTKGFLVSPGNEVFVATTATRTHSTNDIRGLRVEDRDCIFGDEQNLAFYSSYTYPNCLLECQVLSMNRTCHCVPYIFSLLDKTPTCSFKQLQCLVKNKRKFQALNPNENVEGLDKTAKSMRCSCQPGCTETSYVTEVSSAKYPRDPSKFEKMVNETNGLTIENLVLLRVFFKDLYFIRYRRDIVYKWNDLVAAFGGIVGLFVGFSLLSGVEMIYFFTIRLFLKWHQE